MKKVFSGLVWVTVVLAFGYVGAYSIDLFSRNSEGHMRLGDFLLGREEYAAAIGSYKKAILLNKENARAHAQCAYAFSRTRDYKSAARVYAKAYKISSPKNADLLLEAAICYELAGLNNKADEAFARAFEEFPSHPGVAFEFIKFNLRQKRYQEAEALSLEARKTFSAYPEPYLFLAAIKLRQNRLPEAYAFSKKAYEIDPGNEKIKSLFDRLEGMKNKPARDSAFVSEEEEAEFSDAMSYLMKRSATLDKD